MAPVKDTDILKAVKDNDRKKFLKYLSPEKGLGSLSKVNSAGQESIPGGRIRVKLSHINVNCKEDSTGYTPLIIAILKGNKSIVEDLVFHSADIDVQDIKGNTPLHNAAFVGNAEIVDLLLNNKAKVNVQNSDGNTPLHIACQTDSQHRVHILLKLLANDAELGITNKDNLTALDFASMYNKTDAVSVLLDFEFNQEEAANKPIKTNTLALVEGAIRGHKEVVELLLDYGYDPNAVNEGRDTTALMEAVRFVRFPVVETLLKYGAKTDVRNSKYESVETVLDKCIPKPLVEKFEKLLQEYKAGGPTQVPRFLKVLTRGMSIQGTKDYPVLPNDMSWTQNTDEFCNNCTPNCPNTNLLNDELTSCWVAAQATQAWTILDLKYDHTLTAISVYGWDSPQMVRSLELQKGSTLEGPWSAVVTCTCTKSGSSNHKDPGVPQTFVDFTAKSRYWRLLVLDNHDGKCICFHGIRLYGADERIRTLLKENNLLHYADDIIGQGYNTYKKFLLLTDSELSEMVSDGEERAVILKSLQRDRPKEFHPAGLSWKVTPITSLKQGEVIPDFSIKSSPGVKTKVKLEADNGVKINGESVVILESGNLTDPSIATFTGISIDTVGQHKLRVVCMDFPRVSLSTPQSIEIKSKTALRESVAMAFDDMEAMLKDISASLDPVKE